MELKKTTVESLSGLKTKLDKKKSAKQKNSEILKEWNKVREKYPSFVQWMDEVWEKN